MSANVSPDDLDDLALLLPALRTFRVRMEDDYTEDVYVDAHSVSCEGDAAHFYVYKITQLPEGPAVAATAVRLLRPYRDVEDVTGQLTTMSLTKN